MLKAYNILAISVGFNQAVKLALFNTNKKLEISCTLRVIANLEVHASGVSVKNLKSNYLESKLKLTLLRPFEI